MHRRRRSRKASRQRRTSIASALACTASLKGFLGAGDAAAFLAEGFARAGVHCSRVPIADGGEGTLDAFPSGEIARYPVHDAFGRPREARVRRDGSTTIVE